MSSSSEDFGDTVLSTKRQILSILSELDESETEKVEQWFNSEDYIKDLQAMQQIRRERAKVERVADFLRKDLIASGPEAVLAGEHVLYPKVGNLADCTKTNTITVDEFLYDNERLDELVESGGLSKHYCVDCGSKKIEESTVITHSTGMTYLQLIFKYLLPADLSGKILVDVGSRIGAVLFGAYYMSNLSQIIGVEMNKDLCEIQKKCIKKFNMDEKRIKVINSDVIDEKDVLKSADVVMINVMDCFVEPETQIKIWKQFKSCIRKGTYMVTIRSIPDTLTALGVFEEFATWLKCEKPCQMESELYFNVADDIYTDLFFYTVK